VPNSRNCCCNSSCAWASVHWDGSLDVSHEFDGDVLDWTVNATSRTAETTAAASTILHQTSYPFNGDTERSAGERGTVDPYHQHSVKARFTATVAGTVWRLIAVAADEDNYLALEITIGANAGTFCLVQVESGVRTVVSTEHVIPRLVPNVQIWAAIDFDDGELRARVGDRANASTEFGAVGCTGWLRWTRANAEDEPLDYYGELVGIAVENNTGTVKVYGFEAGCSAVIEICGHEFEGFCADSGSWKTDHWTLVSGAWPSRIAGPTGGYWLQASSAVAVLHRNPLPKIYGEGCNVAGGFAVYDYTQAKGPFSVAVLLNCDSSGANGHKLTVTVTPTGASTVAYTIAFGAIGSGGGTNNASYSGTGTLTPVPGGWTVLSGLVSAYRIGDKLKVNMLSGADHERTGIVDCGDFFGVEVSPGSQTLGIVNLTAHKLGEINEHIPSRYFVCPGPTANCLYCSETEDWPYAFVAEIQGLGNSACDCAALNGLLWYLGRPRFPSGCYVQSGLLAVSPCTDHPSYTASVYVQASLLGSLDFPPGFGMAANRIYLAAMVTYTLLDGGGVAVAWRNYWYALDLGSSLGPRVDCSQAALQQRTLNYVGVTGSGAINPCNAVGSTVEITGLN
jgi:hypothetical protein